MNDKIDNETCFSLKDVLQIKIGICTGGNKKHLNENPIYDNSKKVLQGKDIHKYKLSWGGNYVNYNRDELLRAREEQIFLKPEKTIARKIKEMFLSIQIERNFSRIWQSCAC